MAVLYLEDGTKYEGQWFGSKQPVIGEVVFNTGMTGYQEVLTDPSYYGQIVCMTYPLIGNYGINEMDAESARAQVKAFVVREMCELPNNWANQGDLGAYLEKNNICGLQGIDTRALTRKIREKTMRGIIVQDNPTEEQLAAMRAYFIEKPVEKVTCDRKYEVEGTGPHIAVLDFGMKQNILRSLRKRNCRLSVFPASTPKEEILAVNPDGIMLTNGPGDPKDNGEIIETIRSLFGIKPIFGICLGHQLMALAMGGDTFKLKYGHRGCNHPVKDLVRDRVFITSQNHGYAVDDNNLPPDSTVTYRNWNDQTIEGLSYNKYPAFSVQFHPEGAPGPKDTAHLFDQFLEMAKKGK